MFNNSDFNSRLHVKYIKVIPAHQNQAILSLKTADYIIN